MIAVLMPKKFAEEFMKEVKSAPVFSQTALVPGALPERAGESKEASSS